MHCGSLLLVPGAHSVIPERVLRDWRSVWRGFSEELLLMDGVGCSDSSDLTVHCHDSTFCSFLHFPFQYKKTLVWE